MTDGLESLKILINSSTPIIVMETAEERHAVGMVRTRCSDLNMDTFEWSIADGLVRSGSNIPAEVRKASVQTGVDQTRVNQATSWTGAGARTQTQTRTSLSPTAGEAHRLALAMLSSHVADPTADGRGGTSSTYNTRHPRHALPHIDSLTPSP